MGKALIIAEKPSVAGDIAKALGGFKKHDDYYESDHYVLSSAVGHLLELCVPEEFEVKRGKWTFAHLPVIPPHFDLQPIDKNEARLKLLLKLIKRPDVDALINACDAGREGELIFRYIVQYAKAKQAHQAPLAAVHDARPPSARASRTCATTRRCAAGRRGGVPLGIRLAGRHQRHAGDDGVQLEDGRLPPHDRGPGADADAGDPGRARGPHQELRLEGLLGNPRHVRRQGGRIPRALVRREVRQEGRRERPEARAPLGCQAGRSHPRQMPRQAGHRHRGKQADDAALAVALRSDQPAARGQRPVRLLGQDHALAGAGALREAQGADLSAHRLARPAGGLPRHGQDDARHAGARPATAPSPARFSRAAGSSRTSASSTTPRSPTTSPSSRPRSRPST